MSVLFVGSLYCSLQVTEIVQTVKDTDDINTVCDGFLYKILYHIICVGTITQNVLSTEQHLQFGVFEAMHGIYEVSPMDLREGNEEMHQK